jgi:hypothetical protein
MIPRKPHSHSTESDIPAVSTLQVSVQVPLRRTAGQIAATSGCRRLLHTLHSPPPQTMPVRFISPSRKLTSRIGL